MHKEAYIIRGLPSEDYKEFKNRMLQLSQEVLSQSSPQRLKVCLTVQRPPRISVIPFKRKKIAAISVYGEQGSLLKSISKLEGFSGAYLVKEAMDDKAIDPENGKRLWELSEELSKRIIHRSYG